MTDLIRRDDAYAAIRGLTRHIDRIAAITAITAVQPDAKPFDCECGQVGPCKAQFCTPRAAQPHVNETPKSEHDAVNMLTLTAERDRLAAAVDAVMADRKRIIDERDRSFVMVMERAEKAEAEVARLTALLPHPGETAAEVMWRNFQRGVRLEELAKTAGVTRERARQMVRKAEMRMGSA